MKTTNPAKKFLLPALLICGLICRSAWAVPTGFNIQGRLTDSNGVNRNGVFSLKFTIFDSAVGSNILWSKLVTPINVQNDNFQLISTDPDDTGRINTSLAPTTALLKIPGKGKTK